MALEKHVYKAFEEIVGEDNIADDPAILDTYAFNWLAESHPLFAPGKYGFRPEAVLLPGSAREVQDIVRLCNRYRIRYKAHSTGYGIHAFPGVEGVVVLDLRRMNRILEIDERNKFAVVEPYVTWAELCAEIIKVGLFTTPIQAGSQASVLANVSALWGVNTFGNHGGHNGRNLLGAEWVLPSGEILKLGPEGGWFYADGPGPSLRGILRGHIGSCGGLGVVTKVAIKLHAWPGPRSLPTEAVPNHHMRYRLKERIARSKVYVVCFPDWKTLIDFLYKVGDAEIAYTLWRVGGVEHSVCILPDSLLIKQLYDAGLVQAAAAVFTYPVVATILAHTEREFAYKTEVMERIIQDVGGEIPAVMTDPFYSEQLPAPLEDMLFHALVANDTHFISHNGGFVINAAYTGSCEAVIRHQGPGGERLKKKYIARGVIMDDGTDSMYHNSFENNAYVYAEVEYHYDPAYEESVRGAIDLITEEDREAMAAKDPLASCNAMLVLGSGPSHSERLETVGAQCKNFHLWQKRIKDVLDPHYLSDPSAYVVYKDKLIHTPFG